MSLLPLLSLISTLSLLSLLLLLSLQPLQPPTPKFPASFGDPKGTQKMAEADKTTEPQKLSLID